uniref:Uncharacterized protein n=1 Tax=Panagrolaimus sp. PS1159 TaxID=55785 RepID=A0AC35GAQ6_9BILA
MATKSDKYSFIEQRFTTSENQYYNLNLNPSKKCATLIPVQSNSKPKNDKYWVSDNYEEKEKLQSWKKSSKISTFKTLNEDNNDLKKRWKNENVLKTINESTLSLHISAYKKPCFTDSLKFRNPFEFPRQQNGDQRNKPEIMEFKATQQLRGRPSSAVS